MNGAIASQVAVVAGDSSGLVDKKQLRTRLRQQRRALDSEQQAAAAAGLLAQLLTLDDFLHSRHTALYLADDGEIDPVEVMQWLWRNRRSCYVPILPPERSGCLKFAEVTVASRFTKNRFGLLEPTVPLAALRTAEQLELLLLPLVGFDQCGNRVGMGGGFYDATLAACARAQPPHPHRIGLAHALQQVERIQPEPWDIPLPMVVSDRAVHRFTPQRAREAV